MKIRERMDELLKNRKIWIKKEKIRKTNKIFLLI